MIKLDVARVGFESVRQEAYVRNMTVFFFSHDIFELE